MNVEPALFSCDEACVFLGVKRTKLYELIQTGEITSAKLGGKRMFRRSDLEAFVANVFDGNAA